jgi:hypothetical protein
MKSRIMVSGLLTWALLQACSQGSDTDTSVLMGDQTPTELGQGRNALTGLAAGNCLDEVVSTTVQKSGAVPSIQFIQDKSQLADALKLSVSELNAGAAGNPLAQLAQNVTPQPRLTHLLITMKRVTQEQKITSLILKQNALQLYKSNYASFVRTCGDSFVASIETGDALYGIVPIVVESESHKKLIQNEIQAVGFDLGKVFQKLKSYATLEVPVLYLGAVSPTSKSLADFHTDFTNMQNGVTPVEPKKVDQTAKEYRTEIIEAPHSDQFKRLSYVKTYNDLGKKLLKTELCQERIQRARGNSVEFSTPTVASLDEFESAASEQYGTIGATMENCVTDTCKNGVCEITQCSYPGTYHNLVETCETQGPQILPTDPLIYSKWLAANGAWGDMLQVSQTIGSSRAQEFSNAYQVRPEFATSTQVFPMEKDVFAKWTSLSGQLQAPLAKAPYAVGAAMVTDFAGGKIYDSATGIFYVNRLAPYLEGHLPMADERQNASNAADVWASVDLSNGQTLYYRSATKQLSRMSTRAVLAGYHVQRGGLSWTVPVEAEENGSYGASYFQAHDGNFYWDAKHFGVRILNAGLSRLFKKLGVNRVGLPMSDYTCSGNICTANFQHDELSVYLDSGARVCGNGEYEDSHGQCARIDFENICKTRPILCHPIEIPPIRIPPRIPPIRNLPVIRF